MQEVIPEKLREKKLGETNAHRNKKLLKQPGTVAVLRSGAA